MKNQQSSIELEATLERERSNENPTLRNELEDIKNDHMRNKDRIEILEGMNSKPREDPTHDTLDRLTKR